MQKLPSITVITPSFNQGAFIKETIDSVLEQNYPHLEYWVIDGGSTDKTVSILKSYGKKIKWISEKDKGQTDALNKGMKKAKGDIVCYLNSDDVFMPGTLIKVGQTFLLNPSIDWVSGDYIIIDQSGKEIQSFVVWYKQLLRSTKFSWLLHITNYIIQPSTFWRRSVFSQIGFFDQSLRYCMDYDFWLRLMKLHQPLYIPEPLSKFRIHSQSKGGSQFDKQFREERLVERRYSKNSWLNILHNIHSSLTVLAYNVIKS